MSHLGGHNKDMTSGPSSSGDRFVHSPLRGRLLGGGAWAATSFAGSFLLSLIVTALVTRLLTPAAAGTYFLVISISTSGALLVQLGLPRAIVKIVAQSLANGLEGRAQQAVRVALRAVGLSVCIIVAISFTPAASNLLVTAFSEPRLGPLASVVGLLVGVRALGALRAEVFRGYHDLRFASIFQGLDSYAMIAIMMVLLWVFMEEHATLEVIAWIAVAGWIPGVILGFWLLRRLVSRSRGPGSLAGGELRRLALPLWITGIASTFAAQGDMFIGGAILASDQLAVYAVAFRLVMLVSAPMFLMSAVVQAVMAELWTRGRLEDLERVAQAASTVAGIPAGFILLTYILGGSQLLPYIFGEYYSGAYLILALLSAGHLVNVFLGLSAPLLLMTGHEHVAMVVTLAGTPVMMIGGGILGTYYGAVGLALGTTFGFVAKNVFMYLAARHYTGIRTHCSVRSGVDGVRQAWRQWQGPEMSGE